MILDTGKGVINAPDLSSNTTHPTPLVFLFLVKIIVTRKSPFLHIFGFFFTGVNYFSQEDFQKILRVDWAHVFTGSF